METTPMTFKVNIKCKDFTEHPLRMEWKVIPPYHPLYGDDNSMTLFLKQEYNINASNIKLIDVDVVSIEFKSEQDYILWQLHQ